MSRLVPTRPRDRVVVLAGLVVVVLLVLSPLYGRAEVVRTYRPLLPPDGLTTGCYPLPGGVVLDFAYVLRRDGETVNADGIRRRVVLHVDEIGAEEAVARTEALFDAAGAGDGVGVRGRDFEGLAPDAVVRGELVLDLPPTTRRSDRPDCDNVYSTKRFPPDLLDRS